MSKKLFSFLVAAVMLFGGFLYASPAAAWNGVSGQAVDDEGNGWTHGGDVYILNNTTGEIVGTGSLAGDGSFSVAYGDDGITCGCVNGGNPNAGNSMSVFIIYNNGGNGTPGTGQSDYNEAPIPVNFNIGAVSTGTGPTAVTLSGIGADAPASSALPYALAVIVLAGASYAMLRRREVIG